MKTLCAWGIIATFLFLSSCASTAKSQAKHLYECSERVHEAMQKYNQKRYSSAQFILTDVLAKCPGHNATDTALFYLGKSWLGMKKPDEAKLEFDRLVQSFANSPFNEEAIYLLGYSSFKASSPWYLDQTSTKEAIGKLKEFIETYPQSPFADSARACLDSCNNKLAIKEYEAAVFYEKIAQFDAAIVYLKNVGEAYPKSSVAPLAKLSMANDLIETKRPAEANAVLDELLDQTHDETILKKTRALKLRVQKKL
jgi:outer membrane protein assembly factor BamD